jgi:hypothetical protein
MEPSVKHRNMFVQVLLVIITFGIYGIYWFYSTANEMADVVDDDDASPGLWTVLLFVPIVHFYSWYKYSELFERTSKGKIPFWVTFLLWIFFMPAVWFIVQMELNRMAERTLAPAAAY